MVRPNVVNTHNLMEDLLRLVLKHPEDKQQLSKDDENLKQYLTRDPA
jgi:hypothetical protein